MSKKLDKILFKLRRFFNPDLVYDIYWGVHNYGRCYLRTRGLETCKACKQLENYRPKLYDIYWCSCKSCQTLFEKETK